MGIGFKQLIPIFNTKKTIVAIIMPTVGILQNCLYCRANITIAKSNVKLQ